MIREVDVSLITDEIARLCIESNLHLPEDLLCKIECGRNNESEPLPRGIMNDLMENVASAEELKIPICQDTGMAVVFLELGQDVHLVGGSLRDAVNEGVRRGYEKGLLRKSVVSDPLHRINTDDNTPAVLHVSIVEGDRVKITVSPKGFGSENMSRIFMLTPAEGEEGVIKSVLETVKLAGGNPCPPIVLGIGIGGDFEMCAILAKKALCRPVSLKNPDPHYAELEARILEEINKLDIGPQGFGGKTTALSVAIEQYPTHIAGLPVAINIGCHVTRHKEAVI